MSRALLTCQEGAGGAGIEGVQSAPLYAGLHLDSQVRAPLSPPCEIKVKKPRSWYKLY